MGFKIDYSGKKIIATFSGQLIESHILNAFIEITEKGDIKNITHILFDYTNITSFTIVPDFIETIKIYTKFSVSWNKNINAIAVTTNTNLTAVMAKIIKHNKELIWNYMLFDNLNDALRFCNENE